MWINKTMTSKSRKNLYYIYLNSIIDWDFILNMSKFVSLYNFKFYYHLQDLYFKMEFNHPHPSFDVLSGHQKLDVSSQQYLNTDDSHHNHSSQRS